MKIHFFNNLILIIFFGLNIINVSFNQEISCGDLKDCKKCDSSEKSNLCPSCEDEYFSFFNGLLCLPCNDSLYGQVNCEGKCDGVDYKKKRIPNCEEKGCKEGYYNINGNCTKCNEYFPKCAKCSFEIEETAKDSTYSCLECVKGYKLDLNGECKACPIVEREGGKYLSCSNEDFVVYECNTQHANKKDSICVHCPDNCYECIYNNDNDNIECLDCYGNYILNEEKKCSFCGSNCRYCLFDKDDKSKPICFYCSSTIYKDDNTCGLCPIGCERCDENTNDECRECYNKSCIYCGEIEDISEDEGCYSCRSKEIKGILKYECLSCYNNDSVYITNTYQCLNNLRKEKPYFGCIKAIKDEFDENKYECLECKRDFIPVKDDSKCIYPIVNDLPPNCIEAEYHKDSNSYTCSKCQNYLSLIVNEDGKQACKTREKELSYCLEGTEDKNGELKCDTCVENASKNELGICICNPGSIGNNNQFCDKCELSIGNCDECHLEKNNLGIENPICETCLSVYSLNNQENKCEINECEEYPEIAPGCMICKDKLAEYKDKCQYCKNGYFKTNEEKCVYCRSKKYGGPACYECGYEENEDKEKTGNITCKDCFSYFKYLKKYRKDYNYYYENFNYFDSVLYKGKCDNCRSFSESCIRCEFNDDGFKCLLCSPGYYIDDSGNCISFMNKIKLIPYCREHSFYIGNYSFNLIIYNDKVLIEMDYDIKKLYEDYNEYNKVLEDIKDKQEIETKCVSCKNDYFQDSYFLNEKNECKVVKMDLCKGATIVNNPELISKCQSLCSENNFPFIFINVINYKYGYYMITNSLKSNKNIDDKDKNIPEREASVSSILYNTDYANKETIDFISTNLNNQICFDISKENLKKQYDGCYNVLYDTISCTFTCIQCREGFIMDFNHNCHQNLDDAIQKVNCDDDKNSNKRCCYNTLVTYDTGDKACIYDETIYNCIEAKGNTEYINTAYDCTSCILNFLPYKSDFYQNQICHNIFEKFQEEKDIPLELFEDEESEEIEDEVNCPDDFFTPDGKKCYKCNDKNV